MAAFFVARHRLASRTAGRKRPGQGVGGSLNSTVIARSLRETEFYICRRLTGIWIYHDQAVMKMRPVEKPFFILKPMVSVASVSVPQSRQAS